MINNLSQSLYRTKCFYREQQWAFISFLRNWLDFSTQNCII